jgi:AcrR family transcriptional regulator
MSSKNELIEVALKFFMMEGYQKTSLSKIANQLGMSKPALYYYFPNKKALFMACLDVFFKQISDEAKSYQMKGDSVKERVFNIINNFTSQAEMTGELEGFNHYYFVFDAMKYVPEVRDVFLNSTSDFMNSLVSLIQEGIESNELREDVDVEGVLMLIGVFIEGLTVSNYLGYFDGMDNMTDRMFDLLWQGIAKE